MMVGRTSPHAAGYNHFLDLVADRRGARLVTDHHRAPRKGGVAHRRHSRNGCIPEPLRKKPRRCPIGGTMPPEAGSTCRSLDRGKVGIGVEIGLDQEQAIRTSGPGDVDSRHRPDLDSSECTFTGPVDLDHLVEHGLPRCHKLVHREGPCVAVALAVPGPMEQRRHPTAASHSGTHVMSDLEPVVAVRVPRRNYDEPHRRIAWNQGGIQGHVQSAHISAEEPDLPPNTVTGDDGMIGPVVGSHEPDGS